MGLATNPLQLFSHCNNLCLAEFEGHLPKPDIGTNTAHPSILNIAIRIDGLPVSDVSTHGTDKDLGLFDELPEDMDGARTIERVDLGVADGIICTGLFDEFTETAEDYRQRLVTAKVRGLPMLCANPDLLVALEDREVPCAGALAALYEEIGGEVRYFGKPHAPIYDLARQRLAQISGNGNGRILAIGEGVNTVVAGAKLAGIDIVFVTNGLAADQFGPNVDAPSLALLDAWLRKQEQKAYFAIG